MPSRWKTSGLSGSRRARRGCSVSHDARALAATPQFGQGVANADPKFAVTRVFGPERGEQCVDHRWRKPELHRDGLVDLALVSVPVVVQGRDPIAELDGPFDRNGGGKGTHRPDQNARNRRMPIEQRAIRIK